MKKMKKAKGKVVKKVMQESAAMENKEVAPAVMAGMASKSKSAAFLKPFQNGMARRK